jgi:hypothetical protein
LIAIALVGGLGGAASAQSGSIYETEFLDPAQAAAEWEFPAGSTEVSEDGYAARFRTGVLEVILDGEPNLSIGPTFGSDLVGALPPDQAVEAQIAGTSGEEAALFGVSCRFALSPRSVGYSFLVGADGYFTIGRFDGKGNAKALVNVKATKRTEAVDPNGTNDVRGECVGKRTVKLTLYVNGQKVATTVDKAPPKNLGDQAFLVIEVEEGEGVVVEFTRFAAEGL